jgi:hypothetical protein
VLPGGFAHEAQRHLPYSVQLRNRFAAGLTVTPHGSADIGWPIQAASGAE